MPRIICEADRCGEVLPKGRRKYCSDRCSKKMQQRKFRQKQRAKGKGDPTDPRIRPAELDNPFNAEFLDRAESKDGRGSARGGRLYEKYRDEGWFDRIAANEMTVPEVAEAIGHPKSDVYRWINHHKNVLLKEKQHGEWSRPEEVEEALADFEAFCRRYWPDDSFTDYMGEWADSINESLEQGGRLLLLCAQRHFKTDTLIKYSVWTICRDHDVRIVWVSQAADLAEKAVGHVLDHLTHNTPLIEEVLGPGREFRPPPRSNMSWTASEFTIGIRSKVLKSPTMVAIGKGGSLLSRDADLIVCDDLQEYKHIKSPTIRESDCDWFFSDLMSRKMPDTGLAVIGSRQHTQDIYSEIIKRGDDWTIKRYPVHDPACPIPESDHDAHVDCMLNPDNYPHKFMQEQRGQQGEEYFQKNMMLNPTTDATTYITADDIAEIRDHTRRVGDVPSGSRLIVGIDPAEAKPVAAVLWGYDGIHRHVIDCGEFSASVVGLREVLELWPDRYGVREFVFEKNIAKSWLVDAEVKALVDRQRLHIRQHYTSATNKNSNAIGPVAMFQRMRTQPPTITIPAGAGEGLDRIERLVRSWLTFDPDWAGHKHADDDLTMASWFPQPVIDSWERPSGGRVMADYSPVSNPLGVF